MREHGTDGRAKSRRKGLNGERVVAAAIELADEKGLAGVTMRALAGRLGVEAMSLYNHVRSREDLLDRMVDNVFGRIDPPPSATDWRTAMRHRARSVRTVLLDHPWALSLLNSRSRPGPATLRHLDAVLGTLRGGGFSVAMTVRAISAIDSYIHGFILQELSLPFTDQQELDDVTDGIMREMPTDAHPHLAEVITLQMRGPGYDKTEEFEFGLSLVLNGLHPDEA
ncbi:TetR/AcrR family transcriptional regulator [Streptomyces albipurpureus]|uniref:TetR/AcrR family transcriptional regulator n=1 Tax=Streptomyces albipurpureus TaxID=2897419 RepID=A0ABT0UHL5_9ACTN|nr:TetR/AcrR family transcriptional regulator [Streptomyces sp. CWNU-1]MCM2388144.1 TetR/AcrR family transcriptional regulator [Streptomyces sp. CWNU-1]